MPTSKQNIAAVPDARQRKSRVLADGTSLESLIDRDRREVAMRVFSDPEIYQIELERIWAKQWIVVGHESEIPHAGDFITRKVGDDSVILVRRRDGQIDALLNLCPHRGSVVCRAEAGNAAVFRCLYHGWIFNLDGSFRGAPFKDEIYADGMDTSRAGLRRARVGIFAGIIFVNWDPAAPTLDEYLGDVRFYADLMFNLPKRGMEVLGPPQRFIVNANWKTASEQFAGDSYHAMQLHRFLFRSMGVDPGDALAGQLYAPKISTRNGHNLICLDLAPLYHIISGGKELSVIEKLNAVPPPGLPRQLLPEIIERLSEEQLTLLVTTPPSMGGMFPNVGLWVTTYNPLADGTPAPFVSIRSYVPLGVNQFEFCMWVLVARDADEQHRELTRIGTSFSQGAGGFVEGEDGEVWPGMSSAARGYIGRQETLKYWALAGDHPPAGWPGGGRVHTPFSRDDSQWSWWNRYFELMSASH